MKVYWDGEEIKDSEVKRYYACLIIQHFIVGIGSLGIFFTWIIMLLLMYFKII